MKVLHYKSNFLNYSETFIKNLITAHQSFDAVGMCIKKRHFGQLLPIFEKPATGFNGFINTVCFHLNLSLPFYNKTIKKVQPQVIHAHFGFDGYRMIKPAKKNAIPLITSFHGSDVSRLPTEFDWKRRYRKLAKSGDAFTVVTRSMKEDLIQLGFPEEKIYIVPIGIDLESFHFHSTYSTKNNIMMAGRMVEKKGFEDGLKAIKLLKGKNQPVTLDLYGDGILKNELQKKAEKWGIQRLVNFHGRLSYKDMRNEYYKHSLLIAPSKTASDGNKEGLPSTILEAMASGTPVIATDHSGISEAVVHEKTGLLIEEGNYEELAAAILAVKYSEVDIHSIRKAARKFVEEHHELHNMVHQIEKLYLKIIDEYTG